MIILGIDPGTAIVGYGVLQSDGDNLALIAYGAITTPSNWEMPRRLQHIYAELSALIAKYQPTDAVVEKLFFSKNVRTALSVGQARGVALLAAAQSSVAIHEYTPLQVKQAVVGYGRADKNQIQPITSTFAPSQQLVAISRLVATSLRRDWSVARGTLEVTGRVGRVATALPTMLSPRLRFS